MNRLAWILLLAGLAVGAALGYALHRPAPSTPAATPTPARAPAERQVLYWYDPMAPGQHFDKPGKSPYMDMDLVPKYADADADQGAVAISARVAQNLGVRTAPVERGRLVQALSVAGNVGFDLDALGVVEARAEGYLARVFVRAPLQPVRRGEALAELVAPQWASAGEEYLALRRSATPERAALVAAARARLHVLGLSEDAIARMERSGQAVAQVTLVAPRDGVVTELNAREGAAVMPGAPLFRINGIATVWVTVAVPEAQVGGVRAGLPVQVEVPAWPSRRFDGRVASVLSELDPATRTQPVRVVLDNADGTLSPGMFAQVHIAQPDAEESVLVPDEAIIRTGTRSVVIVADGAGHYRAVDVTLGGEADGRTAVLDGLEADQRVVLSGQFLIDSEANLRSALTRLGSKPEANQP